MRIRRNDPPGEWCKKLEEPRYVKECHRIEGIPDSYSQSRGEGAGKVLIEGNTLFRRYESKVNRVRLFRLRVLDARLPQSGLDRGPSDDRNIAPQFHIISQRPRHHSSTLHRQYDEFIYYTQAFKSTFKDVLNFLEELGGSSNRSGRRMRRGNEKRL